MTNRTVRAAAGLLWIGDEASPMLAGEVQFWRMDPGTWRPALERVAELGVPIVSTYLSWRRHEPRQGEWDWGSADPALDARRFLGLCDELGLYVHLKPGPWICAEEECGGYPDWLLELPEISALDAADRPVIGYSPPFLHLVPSTHDARYRSAARRWLTGVWSELGDLRFPDGPVIALQLDNEPGLCFQDALYFGDYHSSAIAAFRQWLAERYGSDLAELKRQWGPTADGLVSFDDVEPPRPRDEPARDATPVRPSAATSVAVRDWTAFTGDALADHLAYLQRVHHDLGCQHLISTVNIVNHPVHDAPLRESTIRAATGALVGVDQYYEPPLDWEDISRLALGAATARATQEPIVWSPELMAGIWRSPGEDTQYPHPTPIEQAAWWGAAQAVGYQGFNAYMLVDRENWAHAPVTAEAEISPFATAVADMVARRRAAPTLAEARVIADVVVVWHYADALDAYASTGTARQPDVSWGDASRRKAYQAWTSTLRELVESGLIYDLWDTESREPPPAGTFVLVPPNSGVPAAITDGLREHGCVVVAGGNGSDSTSALAAAGVVPALRVLRGDGRRAARVLAVVHSAGGDAFAHLVSWGPTEWVRLMSRGNSVVAFVDVLTGERHDGDGDGVALLLAPGHHVFALRPHSS
jgi:hypothetical protein